MEIGALSKNYTVRRLSETDADTAYELMRGNTLFYEFHPPFVTKESILEDMKALPPNKSREDKYYVGFFENTALVAIMDLILNYPAENTAFIGFFMTDVRYQNKGVGSGIISDVCDCLKLQGYGKIRLGVDKGNPQSYAFWTKNRFARVAEADYIVMERVL